MFKKLSRRTIIDIYVSKKLALTSDTGVHRLMDMLKNSNIEK